MHTSWTDHIQLVDGHWSPDGSSLVVSDVAGQWHAYSLGAPDMVKHACYDQFLESDYDRLTRDVNNAVIDDNTQQPPHMRPTRCPLPSTPSPSPALALGYLHNENLPCLHCSESLTHRSSDSA